MADEIKIGEDVLNYIGDINSVMTNLSSAYAYAESCRKSISEEEIYQGDAQEELKLYFESLAGHIQKMLLLYQAASSFISNAYVTHYYNEQQIVDWVIGQIGQE